MAADTQTAEQQLQALLVELLQLDDAATLDFGIYRLLHKRQAELRGLLEALTAGVEPHLQKLAGDERTNALAQRKAVVNRLNDAGKEPEEVMSHPDYVKAAAAVRDAADPAVLKHEVFRDLLTFFGRYWDDGDFIAAPRYHHAGHPPYAVPYHGEEVTLHWANRDQYYVKSSLFFNDLVVKESTLPGRLKLKLVNAPLDRDNVKAADAKQRRFFLVSDGPAVVAEGKDLVVRLQYGPYTPPAAPKPAGKGKAKKSAEASVEASAEGSADSAGRVPKQDKLNEALVEAVLAAAPIHWQKALGPRAEGEEPLLARYVRRYTRRNTADFFIHKNLGRFLRRELDFFIKSELFDLDNLERLSPQALQRRWVKATALRQLADKLITWLHQLEEFQRRLFLKKKLVLRADWAITLDRVPRALWPEIAQNKAQVQRWRELFKIDALPGGDGETVNEAFLEKNTGLVVETALFGEGFAVAALAGMNDLHAGTTGTLIRGFNVQTITLLKESLLGSVSCVYCDPPYNTGDDGFLYKDSFRSSTWLTMIADVSAVTRPLMAQTGLLFVSFDENELNNICHALSQEFGESNRVEVVVWNKRIPKNDKGIGNIHEYIAVMAKDLKYRRSLDMSVVMRKDGLESIYQLTDECKAEKVSVSEATARLKRLLRAGDYDRAVSLYCDFDLMYRPFGKINLSWPNAKTVGPRYEVINPLTGKPTPVPKNGWRWKEETFRAAETDGVEQRLPDGSMIRGRIWYANDTETQPSSVSYLDDLENQLLRSVISQKSDGSIGLENFGLYGVNYPKPPALMERLIYSSTDRANTFEWIMDPFAGSGTTGHAVLNLNREDGGDRRFILIEMGDHFDTVLVPRVLKATYSKDWKDGAPVDRKGVSAAYKILRLESYDDTLENLEFNEDRPQLGLFEELGKKPGHAARAQELREEFLLKYTFEDETRDAQLNTARLDRPFHAKIRALVPGPDAADGLAVRETPVDLIETFNLLIGLRPRRVRSGHAQGVDAVLVEGLVRDGDDWTTPVVVLWFDTTTVTEDGLWTWLNAQRGEDDPIRAAKVRYANGDLSFARRTPKGELWTATEPVFVEKMFVTPDEG